MADFKWTAGIKSLFRGKGDDLNQFMEEVNNENAEHMFFQKEFDESTECRPTFDQISHERIVDEVNKDVLVLRSMESILQERLQSFNSFISAISKARSSFDAFQYADGSLRQGLDALFVYMEQELQQARQQALLGDLRKAISEVKVDTQRKLSDYQREAAAADREVAAAEKKLGRSKDVLERALEAKTRIVEALESEANGGRVPRYSFDSSRDRMKEADEAILKAEKEISDDVTAFLRVLRYKDQVVSASRRAHQRLDNDCKKALQHALKKMLMREKEALQSRHETLMKLERSIDSIDVDTDTDDFINRSISAENSVLLSSQALSILGDLMVGNEGGPSTPSASPMTLGGSSSSGDGDSRSNSVSGGRTVAADSGPSSSVHLLISKLTNPLAPSPLTSSGTSSGQSSSSVSRLGASADPQMSQRPPGHQTHQHSSSLTVDVTRHLTRLFYTTEEEMRDRPDSINMPAGLQVLQLAKDRAGLALDAEAAKAQQEESVACLKDIVKSQSGRDAFITVLNQFRSRKVDVGLGFEPLGAVLWTTLDMCALQNDVHSASVIMMLSQTFYRRVDSQSEATTSSTAEDDEGEVERSCSREYLKVLLSAHKLWHSGGFWDKALWHYAIEQLKTIPCDKPWHDLSKEDRDQAVRRVHAVIFSQVMAVIHSMMELGCTKTQTREFLYRMCAIHQLEESQRQQLLLHLHTS